MTKKQKYQLWGFAAVAVAAYFYFRNKKEEKEENKVGTQAKTLNKAVREKAQPAKEKKAAAKPEPKTKPFDPMSIFEDPKKTDKKMTTAQYRQLDRDVEDHLEDTRQAQKRAWDHFVNTDRN